MTDLPSESTDDPLVAGKYDREMSVYCLSEFAFCPRAGLCAYEQDQGFEEEDQRVNLSYLPIFEPEELARRLKGLITQILWIFIVGMGLFVVTVAGAWFSRELAAWIVPLVVLLATAGGLCSRGSLAWTAEKELEAWQEAVSQRPDPDCPYIQELDWRNIVTSDLAIRRPAAAYPYAPWKLGGRPWRMLEEGDLRVPVFRFGGDWGGVKDQHIVRMAAYCYLVEQNEGFRVPYGIMLIGRSFLAVTVPNTTKNHDRFRRALLEARRVAREAGESNGRPSVPGEGQVCGACHLGEPVPVRKQIEFSKHGIPLPLFIAKDEKEEEYHSHCGDRFRQIPPHKWAVRHGIRRRG